MKQPDKEHRIEMGWLYATDYIKAIHMFQYRLTEALPEDKFFEGIGSRLEVDFNCYLMALRRLERAALMVYDAWGDNTPAVPKALNSFKQSTPFLANVRNVNEHFDDYLNYKGNSKKVDISAMAVWKISINGKVIYRQGGLYLESVEPMDTENKSCVIEWLGYTIDLDKISDKADKLYVAFIKWFKTIPKPITE
jgi:hypothetical protein